MSKRKREKKPSLAERLDIPEDSFGNLPVLELHGFGCLFVTGCRGIVEYGDECVGIMTGVGIVRAIGHELTLVNFSGERMAVEGKISCIELPKEKA